jgi:putative ABC transport system ATP-binding protein
MVDNRENVISVENISRIYRTGEIEVRALHDVNLEIKRGEFTAIAGPSGSGKTTFLNIISGLDIPTSGIVYLDGKPLSQMSGNELSDFRRDHIGFIFQSYNLIPVLSVSENIEYIMLLQGVPTAERKMRVAEILEDMGLGGMEKRRPAQLSGGQQQRVAIARAMVSQPDIILADEPTANIDTATGSALLDIMRELNERRGMTFIFSTHEIMIMEKSKRLIILKDGQIDSDDIRSV